jgi:hypothetical protein
MGRNWIMGGVTVLLAAAIFAFATFKLWIDRAESREPIPVAEKSFANTGPGGGVLDPVISLPSDPDRRLTMLGVRQRDDGLVEIDTRADGETQPSFSRWLIDCNKGSAALSGEGADRKALEKVAAPLNFGPAVDGSMPGLIRRFACAIVAKP